jgi:cell division protein FtsL
LIKFGVVGFSLKHIERIIIIIIIIIIIVVIIIGISFMQGIYTYIPETNHVPREHRVAAILM